MQVSSTVILDTNILHYGVSRDLSDEIANLLPKVKAQGFDLVISSFSKFEVYRGLNKVKIPVTRALVDTITPLDVDGDTFRIAAVLFSCYHYHEATKGKNKYDDDGDIIIGSTAIRYNAAILTANGNDFPRPFFSELDEFIIKRASNNAEIKVYLLRPDIQIFNDTMRACLL
jgi:predicted nucleic acid-binding protein